MRITTCSSSSRISSLNHKMPNTSVEFGSIVVAFLTQFHKVFACLRYVFTMQL